MKNVNLTSYNPNRLMVSVSRLLAAGWLLAAAHGAIAASQSASLDQAANGALNFGTNAASISPVDWENGDQGPMKSHYIEGQSVAYRMVLENLTNGQHTLDIEWDLRSGGANAIDYITHYQCLDPHAFFGHAPELVDPMRDLGFTAATTNTAPIPIPIASAIVFGVPQPQTSFNNPACPRILTMFNGTSIDSVAYIAGDTGDLTAANSATGLRIIFSTTNSTVVFAWGGHLASAGEWGSGQSLSSINGSSYHTRLLALDGKGGNQDRSLKVTAIYPPPQCVGFSGPGIICPTTTATYTASVMGGSGTITWQAQLLNNKAGASFATASSGTGSTASVGVNAGPSTGGFDLKVTFTAANGSTSCSQSVGVGCSITGPPSACPSATDNAFSGPPGATSYTWTISGSGSIKGAATNQTVTVTAGASGSFTLTLGFTGANGCSDACSKTVAISSAAACDIAGPDCACPAASPVFSGPAGLDGYDWTITGSGTFEGGVTTATGQQVAVVPGSSGTFMLSLTTTKSGCGSGTCTKTVTLSATAPTITCPADKTVDCNALTDPGNTGMATAAAGGCSGVKAITYSDADAPGDCAGNHVITRTWVAEDDCGNKSSCPQRISVVDNNPPMITSTPTGGDLGCNPTNPPTDMSVKAQVAAIDNCGTPKIYVSHTDGGTVCAPTRTFTISAVGVCNNTSTAPAVVYSWKAAAAGPTFTALPAGGDLGCNPTTLPTDTSVRAQANATDICGTSTIYVAHTDGGTVCAPTRTFTISAVGTCSTTSTAPTVVYNWKAATTGPTFTALPPGGDLGCNPTTLPTDTSVRAQVNATDSCGPSTLYVSHTDSGTVCAPTRTFTISAVGTCNTTSTAPAVVYSWKATTGPTFTVLPAGGDLGCNPTSLPTDASVKAQVAATDSCGTNTIYVSHTDGGTACVPTRTFRIWAVGACNTTSTTPAVVYSWQAGTIQPIMSCPPDALCISTPCPDHPDANVTGWPVLSNNCGGTIILTSNDVVSGTCPKTIMRTWTAMDTCNYSNTCVQTITCCCGAGLITDTMRCTLPAACSPSYPGIRLLFTPGSPYKLNASVPGQFYYNVFYRGTPGSSATFTLTLPYPFVTQGANPIEVYDGVTTASSGTQTCLQPGNKILAGSTQVTLASYGSSPKVGGSFYTTNVTVIVPPSGNIFLAVHLDYGLKGGDGYLKGSLNGNDAYSATTLVVPDFQLYNFSVSGATTASATVQTCNWFNKNRGQ
jgi:hypothetical protein